mmetsp:Transcript_16823/g.23412  ORF Transcript_16823/g.23412 Transcript_16823/m.23412 type:complete len:223 (+) Transcript_16823:100-768(+)
MEDAYNQYEMEFTRKASVIKDRLKQLPNFKGEKQKQYSAETERQIQDVKTLLNKMEQCILKVSVERAQRLQLKQKNCRADLNKIIRDFEQQSLIPNYDSSYDDNNHYPLQDAETDQRRRLLSANYRVDDTSNRLASTNRIAAESEEIGVGVLSEMAMQKQQLRGMKDNLDRVDENMTTGRKVLNMMQRRIITNHFVLAFIILIELAGIVGIVYFKWISKLIK